MSHDYQPDDDYSVAVPDDADQVVIDRATAEASALLLPALGLGPLTVFCVEPDGFEGDVGIYISGSSSAPVVGLDLDGIKRGADKYGISWVDQVRATIAHELAHAYEESLGLEADDEEATEDFARTFVMDGRIDVASLRQALGADDADDEAERNGSDACPSPGG